MLSPKKQTFIDHSVKEKSFLPSPCKYSHQERWYDGTQLTSRLSPEKRQKLQSNQRTIPNVGAPAGGKYAQVESWRTVL